MGRPDGPDRTTTAVPWSQTGRAALPVLGRGDKFSRGGLPGTLLRKLGVPVRLPGTAV